MKSPIYVSRVLHASEVFVLCAFVVYIMYCDRNVQVRVQVSLPSRTRRRSSPSSKEPYSLSTNNISYFENQDALHRIGYRTEQKRSQ